MLDSSRWHESFGECFSKQNVDATTWCPNLFFNNSATAGHFSASHQSVECVLNSCPLSWGIALAQGFVAVSCDNNFPFHHCSRAWQTTATWIFQAQVMLAGMVTLSCWSLVRFNCARNSSEHWQPYIGLWLENGGPWSLSTNVARHVDESLVNLFLLVFNFAQPDTRAMFPGRLPNIPESMWNFGWNPQSMGLHGQFCGGDPMGRQFQAQTQAQISALQQQNALLNQHFHTQAQSHIELFYLGRRCCTGISVASDQMGSGQKSTELKTETASGVCITGACSWLSGWLGLQEIPRIHQFQPVQALQGVHKKMDEPKLEGMGSTCLNSEKEWIYCQRILRPKKPGPEHWWLPEKYIAMSFQQL